MKHKIRALAAGAVTLAMAGVVGVVLAGGNAALAAGGPTPPWESTITGNLLGSLAFYNAQGQVVTGGSLSASGLGAYAVASAPPATDPGYTKATVSVYTPVSGQNPGTWSGLQISSSTNYPNTTAPAPVGSTANPVETNAGTDQPLSAVIAAFPNNQTTAGYAGLYDVRMTLSGPLGLSSKPDYYAAVISVNTTAGTWSVDYPDYTQNTTTALVATPASPQTPPASQITLTATVSPATAGTVSFWSGTSEVGTTQTVTSGNGVASVTTTPPTGTTPYQAIFTPAIGSADIGSASATLNYDVSTGGPGPTPSGSSTSPSSSPSPSTSPSPSPSTSTSGGSGGGPVWEPVLHGSHKVGSTDSCLAAFQDATTVTYAWLVNNAAVSGATGSTFLIPADALSKTLTCSVTATNSSGSVSGTSTGATIGSGDELDPTKRPVISGPHLPGKDEKVTGGTWYPAAATVTYQWYIGNTKVTGATKSTFLVPKSADDKAVHCVVTASAPGHKSGVYRTPSVVIGDGDPDPGTAEKLESGVI